MYHAAHFQSTEKFQSFTSFLIETKRSVYKFSSLKQSARQFSIQNYLPICSNTTVKCICSEHQSYEITPFAAYLPVHTFPCNQSLQVRSFGPEGTAVDSTQLQ